MSPVAGLPRRRDGDIAAGGVRVTTLLILLSFGGTARPCTDSGRYGHECPPYEVCSVYAGDCWNGKAPLCVCTGRCAGGLTTRIIPKLGMFMASEGDLVGGAFGLEIVPPILAGHLSAHAEWWTENLWRFGLVGSLPLFYSMLIGASVDGAQAHGRWAAGGSLRLEGFPHFLTRGTVFSHVSLLLEGGVQAFFEGGDRWVYFGTLGVRVWL